MGRSDGIKSSVPSYFSGGKEEEEEEDIPDMDNYKDTRADNLVRNERSQLSILDRDKRC